jgi:hypothetical protein
MSTKPPSEKPSTPPPTLAQAAPQQKPRKKLSLDISDVSEVLERKISP